MTVLIFQVTTLLKCHVTFWVGHHHPDSAPYQVLGAMDLVNVETKRFDLTRDHVIDVYSSTTYGVSKNKAFIVSLTYKLSE